MYPLLWQDFFERNKKRYKSQPLCFNQFGKTKKVNRVWKNEISRGQSTHKIELFFYSYDFKSPIYRDNFYSVIVENFVLEVASVDRNGTFYKIKNLDYYNEK